MGLLRNSVKLTEDRARQRAARPTSRATQSSSGERGAGKAAKVGSRPSTGRIGSRGLYRLQSVPADSREDHDLRLATVSRGTREIYWKALLDFEKFCTDGKLSLLNLTVVDKALEIYFTDKFFNGYGPAEGRNALFGYIHFRTVLDRNKARPFPRASRCLRGWERQAPQHIRDPMPYGVVCLFGNHFLDIGRSDQAFCFALHSDCYLRPGEAAGFHRSDLLPPAPRAGRRYARRWALLLGNSARGARTKTGIVDGSVVIGHPHREWVASATAC